ncbi:MAG: bactofilin family protein [Gemmatimonadaceae bacterium]
MAIFTKDTPTSTGEMKSGGNGSEVTLSIIAAGMRVVGDIETEGVIKIEGRIEGSVRAGRQVLIGRQGEVKGDITTREAVIGGKVQGTVSATERLEVQATSTIVGDINTKSIAVAEGGRINGTVRIADMSDMAHRQPDQMSKDKQPVAVVR